MLVDFWAILVFAVIILLFFVLFSATKKDYELKLNDEFKNKDAEIMLISFLNAPAINIDSGRTIADIIAEDSLTGEFKNTKELFDEFFIGTINDNDIVLNIDGKYDEELVTSTKISDYQFGQNQRNQIPGTISKNDVDKTSIQTIIPGRDNNKITLTLTKTTITR
jgi:hypothetical protein